MSARKSTGRFSRPAEAAAPAAGSGVWNAERPILVLLLAAHLALALWGVAKNSVMFDENFHLPAGIAIVTRQDFNVSFAQPPLVKSMCALAALAAGARVPPPVAYPRNSEYPAGRDFEVANRDRYTRVYTAARLVIVALSLLLALLVWRWSRRLHGPRGAALSLAAYAFAPEAIAHAGIVGMDVATALGCTASLYAFWRFLRGGAWAWWGWTALAVGLTLLTRFSAIQLAPAFLTLAAIETLRGGARRPGRLWAGLALLPLSSLLLLNAGYLGHDVFAPLRSFDFRSPVFRQLASAWPGGRLPVPGSCLFGVDYVASLQAAGSIGEFLFGRVSATPHWYYIPFALAIKWPIGFLALLLARVAHAFAFPPTPRAAARERFLWIPALIFLLIGIFGRLNVGIRYLLPVVPLLCVWLGGLVPPLARVAAPRRPAWPRWWAIAAVLVALEAVETASAAPYELSFFNRFAGSQPDRLINDSNVDWGQGLIALRDELRRRGIGRILLSYHGTTDPATYGIDYRAFLGGTPDTSSDWFAVSSYYYVGLGQRMITPAGRTALPVSIDLHTLYDWHPAARPARCMYLFRIR